MKSRYTEHAFERMTERNITRPMIDAVIACGESLPCGANGETKYKLEGLVVVVGNRGIITAYFTENEKCGKWSRKKAQRIGNDHKEMKPHFFKKRGKVNVRQQEYYLRLAEKNK